MVRLYKEQKEPDVKLFREMKDGEVGIIINTSIDIYKGLIVVKVCHKDIIQTLGQKTYWTDIKGVPIKVRILRLGELLEITNETKE